MNNLIKKRLFRNWYVIEKCAGYGSKFDYAFWDTTKTYLNAKNYLIHGPFMKNKAIRIAQKMTNEHYHSVFSGS